MVKVTSVAFKEGGKQYYFSPNGEEYETGGGVIVETARGVEYGYVVVPSLEVSEEKIVGELKPILRKATPADDKIHEENLAKRGGAMDVVREQIEHFGLDMKLIDCEFTFDGSKVIFYYSAPQRVDFRELVKELSYIFHMRIELRQIGIRDEIQMVGGLGPCGRECCCARLSEIQKVSIKMAKTQGLSLNPSKISGLCGRLMCCLSYENDYYAEVGKQMPKVGAEISTPEGPGMVVNINMIKMQVSVRFEDKDKDFFTYRTFTMDELNGTAPAKVEAAPEPKEDIADADADVAEEPKPRKQHQKQERQPKQRYDNENNPAENGGGQRHNKRYNENSTASTENEQRHSKHYNGENAPAEDGGEQRHNKRYNENSTASTESEQRHGKHYNDDNAPAEDGGEQRHGKHYNNGQTDEQSGRPAKKYFKRKKFTPKNKTKN